MRSVCFALATAVLGASVISAIPVSTQSAITAVQQGQDALDNTISSVLGNDLATAQLNFNIATSRLADLGYYISPPSDGCGYSSSDPNYNHTSQKSQQSVVGSLESIQVRLTYLSSSMLCNDTASSLSAWQFTMATLDSTYEYIFSSEHIDDSPSAPANSSASVFGMVQSAQTSLNLMLFDLNSGNTRAAQADYQAVYNSLYNDFAPIVSCQLDAQSTEAPCIDPGLPVSSVNYTQIVGCVQNVQAALNELAGDVLTDGHTAAHCATVGQALTATHDYVFQ